MRLFFIMLICFLTSVASYGQEKTFVREYTYHAGEMDSKYSSRTIATDQLRSILLNELGVYVESEQILTTNEVGDEFSQDFSEKIATISAGITELEILDESWNGEKFWMKAQISVDLGNFKESLEAIAKNQKTLDELEEIKNELGEAGKEIQRLRKELEQNGNSRRIQEDYENQINHLSAGNLLASGVRKHGKEDYYGAIGDFSRAIDLDPDNSVGWRNRGASKFKLGDYESAIKDCSKAIELKKNNYPALWWRAFSYYNLGLKEGTREPFILGELDYSRCINMNPDKGNLYAMRGLCRKNLEKKQLACQDFNKSSLLGYQLAKKLIELNCD